MNLEMRRDLINVSSNHRPDENWKFTDSQGHIHHWVDENGITGKYRPERHYSVPTAKWIVDGIEYFPDGSPYEVGHYECLECGETIEPRYKTDTVDQYITGMTHYYIDGREVSEEEFLQEAEKEGWK